MLWVEILFYYKYKLNQLLNWVMWRTDTPLRGVLCPALEVGLLVKFRLHKYTNPAKLMPNSEVNTEVEFATFQANLEGSETINDC